MSDKPSIFRRLFPNLAALPAGELMMLPMIVVLSIGMFVGLLKLLILGDPR